MSKELSRHHEDCCCYRCTTANFQRKNHYKFLHEKEEKTKARLETEEIQKELKGIIQSDKAKILDLQEMKKVDAIQLFKEKRNTKIASMTIKEKIDFLYLENIADMDKEIGKIKNRVWTNTVDSISGLDEDIVKNWIASNS